MNPTDSSNLHRLSSTCFFDMFNCIFLYGHGLGSYFHLCFPVLLILLPNLGFNTTDTSLWDAFSAYGTVLDLSETWLLEFTLAISDYY